MTTAVVSSEYV